MEQSNLNNPSFNDPNILIYNDFFNEQELEFHPKDIVNNILSAGTTPILENFVNNEAYAEIAEVAKEAPSKFIKKDVQVSSGYSSGEYDVVYSFFLKTLDDPTIASVFAMYTFKISRYSRTPVLSIMDTLKNQDKITMTAIIAYYLNSLRSKHVLFGIENVVTPNYHAARNVIT